MTAKRPGSIDEYIRAAPAQGQPHLRRIREILKAVAPKAREAIKWGTPFFIEPRFLFSFSAHNTHLNFAPSEGALLRFAKELHGHRTTRYMLQLPYDEPLPEALIRKIAKDRLREVSARDDDSFW
jgi:uncharacterized protein YdhG (YjbR/CyaY superfamily)